MNGLMTKALRRKFDIWVKLNGYPEEDRKFLWRHFKKAYKENRKRDKTKKGVKTNTSAFVSQQ